MSSQARQRLQVLSLHFSTNQLLPQQDPATLRTKNGFTMITWIGYHNICVYVAHPNSEAAKVSNLTDRAALGFTDGLPNVMLIPDPSHGLWRPLYQLEDLINRTRKSHVFAERSFPRPNFLGAFRDLGGFCPNDTTCIKCSRLYQHHGVPISLSSDDVEYLHSIQLNVFVIFDEDGSNSSNNSNINSNTNSSMIDVPWARRILSYSIPLSTEQSNADNIYFTMATDASICSIFGQFLRTMSEDVSAVSRCDETNAHGIMFGSNLNAKHGDLKTAWACALVGMCLGYSKHIIVNEYIQTSRSMREYGGTDEGRSAIYLKETLDLVLDQFGTWRDYLKVMCKVTYRHTDAICNEMCLPMMPYAERDGTTKHNGM